MSCLEPDRAGSHITARGPRGIAVTRAEQDPFILTSQSKPQCLGWDTRLRTEVLTYCCPHFITRLSSCPKQETVQRAQSWVWAQLFCNSLGPKHLIPTRAPLQGLQTAFQPSGLRPVIRLANHRLLHQPGCRQWRADAGDRVAPWPAPWELDLAPPQPQASSDGLPRKRLTSGLADSQLNKGLQVGELGAAFPRAGHLPPAS